MAGIPVPIGSTRAAAQIAEKLLAAGKITADQLEGVLHHMQRAGCRVEEALIDTQVISEADLLKYLAKLFQTRFVSTEKLARADVEPATLALLTRKVAEQLQVFPVLFDGQTNVLSVVAADAGDPNIGKQVQLATNAREVKVYVARPGAVRASIAKHYGGDIHAFAQVDRAGLTQLQTMMNAHDRKLISEDSMATSITTSERRKERVLNDRDMERGATSNTTRRGATVGGPASGMAYEAYVETLQVLVSLLENGRAELRGHSPLVARIIRKIAERIGIPSHDAVSFAAAALIHDLGKSNAHHLTALNVAEYEGHRSAGQKSLRSPIRLFESVGLDPAIESAVVTMYERFDGSGFPDGLSGKDIPLGGRLLAIADTYADLTQNNRNPFRKKLSPVEACDVLARYRGKVFDPNLVDLFKHAMLGDDLRARLLADRPAVMLVDADPEESTVLELRLLEAGYDVFAVRSPESALQLLEAGGVEVCIAETDFASISGFELLQRARALPTAKEIPWLFLTRDATRESVSRAFQMGAADYLVKPVPNDVLVEKIRRLHDSRGARVARGVAGSLEEMALPDIVQVLAQGRKTGQLKIRTTSETGEIHFDAGNIVNALWAQLRGEDAFYAMCGLSKGDFSLDPGFKPDARLITAGVESLLLEGMRRLDEKET